MSFDAILREVDQLHNVSTRLEGLEQHPHMSEALRTIAGNVHNTASILAVLVVAKGPKGNPSAADTMPGGIRRVCVSSAAQSSCRNFSKSRLDLRV